MDRVFTGFSFFPISLQRPFVPLFMRHSVLRLFPSQPLGFYPVGVPLFFVPTSPPVLNFPHHPPHLQCVLSASGLLDELVSSFKSFQSLDTLFDEISLFSKTNPFSSPFQLEIYSSFPVQVTRIPLFLENLYFGSADVFMGGMLSFFFLNVHRPDFRCLVV